MTEQRADIEVLSNAQRAALRNVEEMACRLEADAHRQLMADLRSC